MGHGLHGKRESLKEELRDDIDNLLPTRLEETLMLSRLLYLNGLAIILAVLNHAIYRVLPPIVASLTPSISSQVSLWDRLGSLHLQFLQILDQIAISAVPIFLFVSGLFISIATPSNEKTIRWNIIVNRIKFLVIPYLVWSVIVISIDILEGKVYSMWELLNSFLVKGATVPYYYVPMLITYLLLSPLVIPLARSRWKILLILATSLAFVLPILYYLSIFNPQNSFIQMLLEILNTWKTPVNFLWFALGMVIGFHQAEFKNYLSRIDKGLLSLLLFITLMLYTLENNLLAIYARKVWVNPQFTFLYPLFTYLILLSFFALERTSYPLGSTISKLGVMSYGIYLIHYPLQVRFIELIFRNVPQSLNIPSVVVLLVWILGLLVPALLITLVARSPARRFSRYLFG